ncbi:hypothetical protein FB381_4769 [Nocardioides albertanoniae]|uniref:Uncharacterized protein n=1 Tax=Nocardioides albertanoniae TaxID=1175486 RepID=A0A543AE18_9ACTN|nr:hypothetical protein [Nocardioides albertanoniae]TQL70825.1 hypothetical protein FB381_4769 [Nocardioides albertanoniae]
MSSKILGGLRRSLAATLIAGGLVAAGAGGAHAAQGDEPIRQPDRGPAGPVTVGGAALGSDAAVTATTDGTTVVGSGRAHLESPLGHNAGGVVHHDDTGGPLGRGARLGDDHLGFAGGVTGDTSSVDVVGTGRIGVEKRYYVQD